MERQRTREPGAAAVPRVGLPPPRLARVFPGHLGGSSLTTSAAGFAACRGGQSLPAALHRRRPRLPRPSIVHAFYFSLAGICGALFSISGKIFMALPFSLILLETSQGFFALVVPVCPRHPRPRPLSLSLSRGAPTAPPAHHLRAGAPFFFLPTLRGWVYRFSFRVQGQRLCKKCAKSCQ